LIEVKDPETGIEPDAMQRDCRLTFEHAVEIIERSISKGRGAEWLLCQR
jgi:hypothetical protein